MTARLHSRHEPSPWRRAGAGIAAALLSLAASTAAALELYEILEASRVSPPARVDFREQRLNPLFAEAMVLGGYLEYLDRGVLNKIIEVPFREAFLIRDGRISLERDGESRSVSLQRSEELTTIIGAIEAILSGEAAYLEREFEYEISGTRADWSIELKPRSRRLARRLYMLSFSGGDSVARILIDLQDGERQVMDLLPAAPEL